MCDIRLQEGSLNKPKLGFHNDFSSRSCLLYSVDKTVRWLWILVKSPRFRQEYLQVGN